MLASVKLDDAGCGGWGKWQVIITRACAVICSDCIWKTMHNFMMDGGDAYIRVSLFSICEPIFRIRVLVFRKAHYFTNIDHYDILWNYNLAGTLDFRLS